MIRSGYQADFEARLATGRARAEYAERLRRAHAAADAMRDAINSVTIAMGPALANLRKLAEALGRIDPPR